jgi:hypothetical protein
MGAGRLIAQFSYSSHPSHFRGEARAKASTARYLGQLHRGVRRGEQVGAAGGVADHLDDKPLIVLTADTGNAAGWQPAQDHMATLSTNSSHRVAQATTHESLLYDEADPAQASQARRTAPTCCLRPCPKDGSRYLGKA